MKANARALAATALVQVVEQGRSLSDALPEVLAQADARDRALVQELGYGVSRWYPRLDAVLALLLQKPLKSKDQDLHCLLLVGLYQLGHMQLAAHGVVHDTVEAVRQLNKPWATKLVNGVLRNYQRRQQSLDAQLEEQAGSRWAHPDWLIERLRADWPDHWQEILTANNQRPPMSLRVNARCLDREAYRQQLEAAELPVHSIAAAEQGLQLEQPVAVERLPGFADGLVSVQDGAAQLAAQLLEVQAGMRVLDACAAPGGKTCHILERSPELSELVALDRDAQRLLRIEENLERLGLQASVVAADAGSPDGWWDNVPFDRILLDAPCTATGVIRRHPDIKLLRQAQDIATTCDQQQRLLQALWPLLAPGGMLVYCTCSVVTAENSAMLERFLGGQEDAREQRIDAAWGHACVVGRQILPGEQGMDGFYYACIRKQQQGGQ